MDVLRRVSILGIIYLMFATWCLQYIFPKMIIARLDHDTLCFLRRRLRILRNLALALIVLHPPLFTVVFEIVPSKEKMIICTIGIILAFSIGSTLAETSFYLSYIRRAEIGRSGQNRGRLSPED